MTRTQIFLICQLVIIVSSFLGGMNLQRQIYKQRERQKEQKPIDSIPLIYDCKGNRKEARRELYEDMKGRKAK
jgi:hypothetical protein